MSRVRQVEFEIQQMSSEELAQFREWFAQFDTEAWDRRIEADARTGKLDALAAEALRDHESGLSSNFRRD
jgi:hypothetical protein